PQVGRGNYLDVPHGQGGSAGSAKFSAAQGGRDLLVGRAPGRGCTGDRPERGRGRVELAVDHLGDLLDRGDPVRHRRVVLGEGDDEVAAVVAGEAADAVDPPAVGGQRQPAVL